MNILVLNKKKLLLFLSLLFIIVFLFIFLKKNLVPNTNFKTINGKNISTKSLLGKVYLVNFWATSCKTCIEKMPDFVNTYNKFKNYDFNIIAVAMAYDPPNYVLNYSKTRKLPFIVAIDIDGSVAKSFGNVNITPTSFLINKNGQIIKKYVGSPEIKKLNEIIRKELAL